MERKQSWVTSRPVGAIIGLFAGGVTILVLEWVGHQLFGAADPADLSSVTMPMFLSVLVAWVAGCWVAGTVATTWSKATSVVPGVIVGCILLLGAVANMFAIPHPMWMMVGAFILMPGAAVLSSMQRVSTNRSKLGHAGAR